MGSCASNIKTINAFLEHMRTDLNRSPQTIQKYRYSYVLLLEHLGGTPLERASTDDLRAWLRRPRVKQRGPHLAPATLKREIMELRSLYKWLQNHRGLVDNPAARLDAPKVHNENPNPAPERAWRRLWASDLDDSMRVACGLAYYCGLRRHEVTLLTPANFVDHPHPRLTNFKRKGGQRATLPWLSCVRMYAERRPDLVGGDPRSFTDAVDRLRARNVDRPLLDWPLWRGRGVIDPFHFNRRLIGALKAAGLPHDAFTPHAMRHSFCTNLIGMGVPLLVVSRLAGHSSVAITQRYVQTTEDPLADLLGTPGTVDRITAVHPWDHNPL